MPAPPNVVELPALPRLGPQMLRAAVARKGRGATGDAPRLQVRGARADPARLARYREVCGLAADGFLPPTYPQVLATPLHMALVARPEFPSRALGLVHVRNAITQERRLREDEALDVACFVEGRREVRHGLEFDLHTHVAPAGGAPVWRAVTTVLARRGGGEAPVKKGDGAAEAPVTAAAPGRGWEVPADTGRRYARASGDYNPIHLTALTARAFGFRRAIAHGMWTLARCLAELGAAGQAEALSLTCEFRRPLMLPARVGFTSAEAAGAVEFRVLSSAGKPHLVGALRAG